MTNDIKLIQLLRDEMVLALGCTEPIAIAYAAALAAKHLGHLPDRIIAECSGNMIKNVKSVIVPNSDGMRGIDTACLVGAFYGDADKKLEVLSQVTKEQAKQCRKLRETIPCEIKLLESPHTLHIIISTFYGDNKVSVEIQDSHTNVVKISKDGEILQSKNSETLTEQPTNLLENITIKDIINFSRFCDYSPLIDLLELEIECNSRIANEGINNNYGANVGKIILNTSNGDLKNRAKAFAAAGSDARMSGCDLPVMINSGSGNQGLTVSLPIIVYADQLKTSQSQLYRALILSNLIALYEKSYIGKLSAYCGVVCAASGSAAGITFLMNGNDEQIENAVINTLGTLSGMVCDGAKASCAAKIAASVDAAITSHEMAMLNNALHDGDGIVKQGLDKTVKAVGKLANHGMRITDKEILNIMLEK